MSTATTRDTAAAAARHAGDWLEKLARLGYASRGVLYLIIGGLALLAALGEGGGTTGTRGAIAKVLEAPAGWLIVLTIALGLAGYSAWRVCQAIWDADGQGTSGKGLAIRASMLVSGVIHAVLALWAGKLALGYASSNEGSGSEQSWVATVLSQPLGRWLVMAAGIVVVIAGVAQFTKGHRESFERHLGWDVEKRRKLITFCKVGLYARGVIFAITGVFIFYAGLTANASQAGGLEEALDWLRSQSYGAALLAATSAGLICFGIYSWVEAAYRRIHTPA